MKSYQVRVLPGCTYALPSRQRVLHEGETTIVSQDIYNKNRDLFDVVKMNPLIRVRVKDGLDHRSGAVQGGQICWVTNDEIESFGDKFTILSDSEEDVDHVIVTDKSGTQSVAGITSTALALADEHGIDLSTITGTGAKGRILKADIQAAIDGDA